VTTSRSVKSFRNASLGVLAQLATILLAFGVRTAFIATLGIEYLGVNGLFTNVLTVLSLAEAGFGSAVTYRLYKPLAEGDTARVSALIAFHARVYRTIGLVVAGAGLLVVPFLGHLIREDTAVEGITAIYLLFLLNSVSSYFFAHKWAILIADQRSYLISGYEVAFSAARAAMQVLVLMLTANFLLYLVVQQLFALAEYAFIARQANRTYPFLLTRPSPGLPREEVASIWADVRATAVYRVSAAALDGTDAIIISAFVGLVWVGKYSNYSMIIAALALITAALTSALTASVGNFTVQAANPEQDRLLRMLTFGHFVVHGLAAVSIWALVNPFIEWWVGAEYLLSDLTALVIAVNWFIVGMLQPVWMFRSTLGLFRHGRWRPVASAVLNIIVSIVLAGPMGVFGVLLGTTITRLATNAWFDPLVVYRHGLGLPVGGYYLLLMRYSAALLAVLLGTWLLFPILPDWGLPALLTRFTAGVALFAAAGGACFGRSAEFTSFLAAVQALAREIRRPAA